MDDIHSGINYFRNLFEYNLWGNERAFNSIIQFEKPPERLVELLSHVTASQIIWLSRILGKPHDLTPWQRFTPGECIDLLRKNNRDWIDLINNMKDNSKDMKISYLNMKGESFTNTIRDIIIHVINHASYHRGQIASKVRNSGGIPAVTDYIIYKRE